ncbi:GSCFA family protein [Rhodobacter aestuarii]|uniref:GSCFA family protein n=1 Tax=Rhodobacter aestuarii TaxID=453582 RepID=A0A1N7LER3_9RHOB|nr:MULTISPECIES: GSCFA domain-containing protein [Rhodobacter]PTV95291.1 GSCFA family protein [Rhodobacter aestuarii]SIS72319.1 GSCFA family protein [Rhodobacter aestuarii]SOC08178.1 GSCFA family protein [Rhodobacter sp. JA431]
MTSGDNPYKHIAPRGFWRSAVAEPGLFGFSDLWTSAWDLPADAIFATFGSCFAQHISRALMTRKMNWLNAEPAPGRTPPEIARSFNYGVFSARTGNIYTAAQLLIWARLAAGHIGPEAVELWTDEKGHVHDLLRPKIEPEGFVSEIEARASVLSTARAFKRCITEADVFVFTLGLTEGWINSRTGQSYSICPGTGVGTFDPEVHVFKNYTYPEILRDLELALELMWEMNPDLKVLLTVSPVPLVATASGDHVLVATQYSKSVLRAVAGDVARAHAAVDYFPSYEIIASPPTRGTFFEPNMRGIAAQGVDLVMGHFFKGLNLTLPAHGRTTSDSAAREAADKKAAEEELVCEEMILERFNEA